MRGVSMKGMKGWFNQQGKLFGLINPWDLLVILLLFVLAIKVITYYRPAPLQLQKTPVKWGLLIESAPPYLAQSLAVGQNLFHDRTNGYLGKITAITVEPAPLVQEDDGKLVQLKSPYYQRLKLELTREAEVLTGSSKYGIYFGRTVMRVGETIAGHTLYTAVKGEVAYLKIEK